MTTALLSSAPKRTPILDASYPADVAMTHSVVTHSAAAAIADRRGVTSEMEIASLALSHAVQYLSSEQRAGRCTSVRGNRQAINILCTCAEALTELERREPAREALTTLIAVATTS